VPEMPKLSYRPSDMLHWRRSKAEGKSLHTLAVLHVPPLLHAWALPRSTAKAGGENTVQLPRSIHAKGVMHESPPLHCLPRRH
jgi:hypothetical protein